MATLKAGLLSLLLLCGPTQARIAQYTQDTDDTDHVALGFSVPQAVSSTSALAGFRDYASLLARLDMLALQSPDLQRHEVGQSRHSPGQAGTPQSIYAYVFGHEQSASMLQVGGLHAREWASPEAVTYIVEQLVQHANDGGLESWLRDHSSIILLPLGNPDGLQTSQQFFDQTRVAEDPQDGTPDTSLARLFTPRDGRMRRKNLFNTDGLLDTADDTLLGVDLNRNIERHFNTDRASSDPQSLVYNGPADASEPEIQALIQASTLLPADSLRLFVDTHSFGRIFFYNRTPNDRLYNITRNLVLGIRQTPPISYSQQAEQTGVRIGANDEYFAYKRQVPSYTLEIEPGSQQQAAEYGGNANVSHSGFILPDAEVPRMRDEIYQMMRLAYYRQAGAAFLQGFELRSLPDDTAAASGQWQNTSQARQLQLAQNSPLQSGQRYRLLLTFSKPMRWRNPQGQIAAYPGQAAPQPPQISLQSGTQRVALDSSSGHWQDAHYAADQFSLDFTLASQLGSLTQIQLQASDLAGQALDSNPATLQRWQNGAWQNWEDENGQSGDSGGADHNMQFEIAGQPTAGGGGSGSLSPWLLSLMLLRKRRFS